MSNVPAVNLQTSRELDAEVAAKVMGWANVREQQMYSLVGGHMGDEERMTAEPDGFEWRGDVGEFERTVPHYSSGMWSAWLVVEEMSRRGFHARLKTPFVPDAPYFAGFTPHGSTGWNGRGDYEASGETMALAICRAALLFATYYPALPPLDVEARRRVETRGER